MCFYFRFCSYVAGNFAISSIVGFREVVFIDHALYTMRAFSYKLRWKRLMSSSSVGRPPPKISPRQTIFTLLPLAPIKAISVCGIMVAPCRWYFNYSLFD